MTIIKSPFRLSLFGGSSDYKEFYEKHGSLIIGTTINKYNYICIRTRPNIMSKKSVITYSKLEEVISFDEITNPLIKETLKVGKTVVKCIDCYKASFNYCPCGSRTYKENKLCSPCYKEQLKIEQEHLEEQARQQEENRLAELLLTKVEEEKKKANILDGYFISKCQKCKKKSKGNFKICIKCKEKNV